MTEKTFYQRFIDGELRVVLPPLWEDQFAEVGKMVEEEHEVKPQKVLDIISSITEKELCPREAHNNGG